MAKIREKFPWQNVLFFLLLGGGLIAVWVFALASIAIATFSREKIILFMPSETAVLVTTFLMLLGVAIASIQIARILEHLAKRF